MAFVGTVRIKASADVQKILKEAAPQVARKHLRKALRAGAVPIRDEAKATSPELTGAMKRSIKIRNGKTRSKWRATVLVQTRDGDFTGNEFYAAFLEYGTEERTQKKTGRKVGRAPKLATFENAFNARKDEAEAIIEKALEESVMNELKGLK